MTQSAFRHCSWSWYNGHPLPWNDWASFCLSTGQRSHRSSFRQVFKSMEKAVMISRATFYSTYAGFSAIFPAMVSGQAPKTNFFGELPAVIHSFVVELLAEPHTMIRTLTERTGRPYVSCSIPDYSMEIPPLTKIWVPRCSWRSNVLENLRFNSVSHFRRLNSESVLVFKPVSES